MKKKKKIHCQTLREKVVSMEDEMIVVAAGR